MKVIIIYYSRGGTTKEMAKIIGDEIKNQKVNTKVVFSEDVSPKDLLDYDGIIIGSPTYYGCMASEIKKFLDATVSFHGKLDGKVGGSFSSSANLGGGNETTIISILEAMLIHGMIIQGNPNGDHYGPVALNRVDTRCKENCQRFAKRFVKLLKELKG